MLADDRFRYTLEDFRQQCQEDSAQFQSWNDNLEIRPSCIPPFGPHSAPVDIGVGVFAKVDIPKGAVLCNYPGRQISWSEWEDMVDDPQVKDRQSSLSVYVQEIGTSGVTYPGVAELYSPKKKEYHRPARIILGHTARGGFGHYVNHTPHRNHKNVEEKTKLIPLRSDAQIGHQSHYRPELILFASKKIKAGQELLRSYGRQYFDEGTEVRCPQCGSE